MADSGGGPAAAAASSSASPYHTLRSLVERADRKFARVRDLPPHSSSSAAAANHCFRKVFKAYTRLWRFQQEYRAALVESGMRRWEIGEIASRIGQLYYGQYQRTSECRFLLEAYVFYEAILSRGYFQEGRGKGPHKAELGVRAKELRFYARFIQVALLMDRAEVVRQLVDRFRALLDDCTLFFPGTDFKEWKLVLQEITRFLKADRGFPTTRPLRYNAIFDSHSSSIPHLAKFHPSRVLKLQDAVLTSYHRNEVKFAELTMDTYRMLQSLEWEPSGSFYQKIVTESSGNGGGVYSDISGASGLIDINLSADMTDLNLPPNPRKVILYHPSVPQIISVVATICEGLSSDHVLLLYLSASGRSDYSTPFQKENSGHFRTSNAILANQSTNRSDHVLHQHSVVNGNYFNDHCGSYLWFGSRGSTGPNKLYPADLIPFTRRPLFLIIDSDSSNAFKVIHGSEREEIVAMLLSPLKEILHNELSDTTPHKSQFTFFLTAPLQAFCQLVGCNFSSDIDAGVYNNADSVLITAFSKWEVLLCSPCSLHKVWAQVFPDPFLRRLLLRFIFCRSVLHLFVRHGKGSEHLPSCLPELPESVSPDSPSVQSSIYLLAEVLGVVNLFQFTSATLNSSKADPS